MTPLEEDAQDASRLMGIILHAVLLWILFAAYLCSLITSSIGIYAMSHTQNITLSNCLEEINLYPFYVSLCFWAHLLFFAPLLKRGFILYRVDVILIYVSNLVFTILWGLLCTVFAAEEEYFEACRTKTFEDIKTYTYMLFSMHLIILVVCSLSLSSSFPSLSLSLSLSSSFPSLSLSLSLSLSPGMLKKKNRYVYVGRVYI